MAAELVTPLDELTGLPLPLVPPEEPFSADNVDIDWHHHFHPRRSPILRTPNGPAIRNARLQLTDYEMHHFGYHRTYVGPPLPETDDAQFATVIMSTAGYMPEQGISFTGDQPSIVRLSQGQRHQLQTSGEIKLGSRELINIFIREYVMSQLSSVDADELNIEEFVTTNDPERRRVLGHNLLALITDRATEPINEVYHQARRRQLILPNLPNNVRRFAKARLGPLKTRDKLVGQLHSRLATA